MLERVEGEHRAEGQEHQQEVERQQAYADARDETNESFQLKPSRSLQR